MSKPPSSSPAKRKPSKTRSNAPTQHKKARKPEAQSVKKVPTPRKQVSRTLANKLLSKKSIATAAFILHEERSMKGISGSPESDWWLAEALLKALASHKIV